MDALSELLKSVALNGALFYNAEYFAPWSFRSPPSRQIAPCLSGEGRHVIVYHLVSEGRAWVQIENGERTWLGAGEVVVFPHGDAHEMGNGQGATPVDHGAELQRILAQGLATARMGSGGELTKFVCGYMACDPQLCRSLFSGLPPLLKVGIRDDPAGVWLEDSIRFSVTQAASSAPGAEAVLAKLSEALFVETLRRYTALLPQDQGGWLAGARDPQIGKALALIHSQPERPWALADLAAAAGVCRTSLSERFRQCLGQPPMEYLAKWRLQVSARLLTTTSESVGRIAAKAGYESESAFNRAFKRQFGVPPARYRREGTRGAA